MNNFKKDIYRTANDTAITPTPFAIKLVHSKGGDTNGDVHLTLTNNTTATVVTSNIPSGTPGGLTPTYPAFASPGDSVTVQADYECADAPVNQYNVSLELKQDAIAFIANFYGSGTYQGNPGSPVALPTTAPFTTLMTANASDSLNFNYTFIMPAFDVFMDVTYGHV